MVTSKTTHVQTLILGGGITGLATAYALEKQGRTDYLLVEAKDRLGGLCATTFLNGYHFDYGGHLLHLHTPPGKTLVKELLATNLSQHKRHAFIYTNGMRVPYPFQTNLWALHPELRALCLEELTTLQDDPQAPRHFEQWCLQSFGRGLYEAFFRPYNEKLWGRPLTELTCEWCGPFVPAPHRREIVQSATQPPTALQGYNATFYYPKTGGCGALIEALAKHVHHVRTHAPVTQINLTTNTALVNNEKIEFENLVSTIPLPQLVNLLQGHEDFKQQALQLEAQPVTVYHLAIARTVEPFSWIYCPDAAQPFYRVGLTSGFAPTSVPGPNTALFYIELPGLPPTTPQTEQQIWDGLHQKGLVNNDDVKLFSAWQTIPYAYVIFNRKRAEIVPGLLSALEKENCFCAGRYGRWEYSFMERSLIEAWELAQWLH